MSTAIPKIPGSKRDLFLLFSLGFFLFCLTAATPAGSAPPSNLLARLASHPKIKNPAAVLKNLHQGQSQTRIIVQLIAQPSTAPGTTPAFQKSAATKDLKDPVTRQQVKNAVARQVYTFTQKLAPNDTSLTGKFSYLAGFAAEVTVNGLQQLADHPEVAAIEEDALLQPHLRQGISLMNAATVRASYDGAGVAIAICDTGIDYGHPRLGDGGFPNSKVIGGYDTGQNDADPMDANGHGTACAGIAAGDLGSNGDYIGGVAHQAKLYALKITNTTAGGSAYTSDIMEAWEWSITHQLDDPNNPILVISTSFGGGQYSANCDASNSALAATAANASSAGIAIFVSAGNDGFCNALGSPACLSEVISVGAAYDADIGSYYPCISSQSCAPKYASTGCPTGYYAVDDTFANLVTSYSNTAPFLTLLAPATKAYTTDISGTGGYSANQYVTGFGGTSAATPYAAGAAAILQHAAKISNGNFLSPAQLKNQLVNSGDLLADAKAPGISKPRINLQAAVAGLDSDGDGVPDNTDLCPGGDDSIDIDGDGVADFCDACPGGDDRLDADGDGSPDACDRCPGGNDALDADNDGTPDFCDPCPLDNPDDSDGDGVCDSTDPFPANSAEWRDRDNDGIGDNLDNCPATSNFGQLDSDHDTLGDVCDPTPFTAFYGSVLDAPHNSAHGVGCTDCHSFSLWWQYSPVDRAQADFMSRTDALCNKCHGSGGSATQIKVHSSTAMAEHHRKDLAPWTSHCLACHDPHNQGQLEKWRLSVPDQLYLVTGTMDGNFRVEGGQTTFDYSLSTKKLAWADPENWGRKNSFLPASGLILVTDLSAADHTLAVISATPSSITVKGGIEPALDRTFGLIYGQMINETIATPVPENRVTKFLDPRDPAGGYTDANTPLVTGICQVCHQDTLYWTRDGGGAPHYSGENCTGCHLPALGFKPVVP